MFGAGLHERVDLRLRYTYVHAPRYRLDVDGIGVTGDPADGHVFSVGPKFGLIEDHLALVSTFQLAVGKNLNVADTFNWQPTLIGTYDIVEDLFEVNLAGKLIFVTDSGGEPYGAMTLGFGIGRLESWALRPEFGFLREFGETGAVINAGAALTYAIAR